MRWLVSDQLGTPRMVIGQAGTLASVSRRDFLPFGEELYVGGRTGQMGYVGDTLRHKFTGYERDAETSLDFAQARYHSPAQGRFTSVDPLFVPGERVSDPQRLALYTYARNNPFKYTDPTGLDVTVDGPASEEYRRQLQKKLSFNISIIDKKLTVVGKGGKALSEAALKKLGESLDGGEKELFKAIMDTTNHARITAEHDRTDFYFGANAQAAKLGAAGHNILDMNEANLLDANSKQNGMTGSDLVAHETLEAYYNAADMTYDEAHCGAAILFGQLEHIPGRDTAVQDVFTGAYTTGTREFKGARPDKTTYTMRVPVTFHNPRNPASHSITKVEIVP